MNITDTQARAMLAILSSGDDYTATCTLCKIHHGARALYTVADAEALRSRLDAAAERQIMLRVLDQTAATR